MKSPTFIDTGYILALANFVVMQEYKLTHALTTDRDFEQAGFQNALVKAPVDWE